MNRVFDYAIEAMSLLLDTILKDNKKFEAHIISF